MKIHEISSKNNEKSWQFIEFHWKIMKIHEISSKNHENSWNFIENSWKSWKFMKFDRKKQENKTSIFYAFKEYLCSTEARFAPRCRTKKLALFTRSPSIFGPLSILFFRFWNTRISHSGNFPEYLWRKKDRKMMHFCPGEAGWAGLAGLGLA